MHDQPFLQVNWTDGMKINKSHFVAQDNAVSYLLAKTASCLLNDFNYGLLALPDQHSAGVKLVVSLDNQNQVRVRLLQCLAITRGGYCFQRDEDDLVQREGLDSVVLQLSIPFDELKEKASAYYITVSVDPYRRTPFGLVDVKESPPRLPFTIPHVELGLVPINKTAKNVLGLFQLPVGRLQVVDQRVLLDDHYIPPCASLKSHVELRHIHADIEQFYGSLELFALQIIQKIQQKKQVNDMAAIAQKLCENILLVTASHIGEIKTDSLLQPPVQLVTRVSALARTIKNTLDCYINSGKEEFINYCTEWCNVTQGDLEGVITGLCNISYNHLDVHASLNKVTDFVKIISGLLGNLARLEYIGKRKEAGIFVKEHLVVLESEEPRKRKSFLAD